MSMTPNPPWVDRALNKYWGQLELRFGQDNMPLVEPVGTRRKKRKHKQELGCGHYGCVLETATPERVMKVTSDASEAAFVTAALSLDPKLWPRGMIRYFDIVELAGETHRRRPVFAVLRRHATRVGCGLRMPEHWVKRFHRTSIHEGLDRLGLFNDCARIVRLYLMSQRNAKQGLEELSSLERWAYAAQADDMWPDDVRRDTGAFVFGGYGVYTGARGAAVNRRRCEVAAEMMANTHFTSAIGEALEYYLNRGLLLADVHRGNIGEAKVDEEGYDWDIVITDPGHMVPLKDKWLEVQVPVLQAT